MANEILIVIPVRMGSSRFPGKPLAKILGSSMLSHVVKNAQAVPGASKVVVATCDTEIVDECEKLGVESVMTSSTHVRASERTHEALVTLDPAGEIFGTVIMLQGDEPCITAEVIQRQLDYLHQNPEALVTNLVGPISSREEFTNPNTIKCAVSGAGEIIFMSRAAILESEFSSSRILARQVCSISFSRSAIELFIKLGESTMEASESIDLLRLIEAKVPIRSIWIETRTHPVDTPSDIKIVERILQDLSEPGL